MKNSRSDGVGPEADLSSFRVPFDDELAVPQLARYLDQVLDPVSDQRIVIVCVGTDRSTGDAFGPIVGTRLRSRSSMRGIDVHGTLDEPVHAVNLTGTLSDIYGTRGRRPFILAVDACLGKFDHVGQIIVERGPLRPGAGVKKTLPAFGDYTLTGVVNVSGFMEYFVLQNTRLGIVMRMCDVVVSAVESSVQKWQLRRSLCSGMQRA